MNLSPRGFIVAVAVVMVTVWAVGEWQGPRGAYAYVALLLLGVAVVQRNAVSELSNAINATLKG